MQRRALRMPLLVDATAEGPDGGDSRMLLVINGLTLRNLDLLAAIQQDEQRLRRRPALGEVLDHLVSKELARYGFQPDIPF